MKKQHPESRLPIEPINPEPLNRPARAHVRYVRRGHARETGGRPNHLLFDYPSYTSTRLLGDTPRTYVFSTEGFCSRLLKVHNSVERNVICRTTCVDTNEICSNLRNLAADALVINERKKDVLPTKCTQHRLKVLHGGDSTSARGAIPHNTHFPS